MKKHQALPKVVEKTKEEISEIQAAVQSSSLSDDVKDFLNDCVDLSVWLPSALESQKISISRLKTLVFGKGYTSNKKSQNSHDATTEDKESKQTPQVPDHESSEATEKQTPSEVVHPDNKKVAGHGRLPHTAYQDFTKITLATKLAVGDLCPERCGGRLYSIKPGVLVRIRGQNVVDVYKYFIEKLRCAICGMIYSAELPKEVGDEKYDAAFKSWVALQKYYVAVPFYRQEYFQRLIKFPLPDATQWELVERVAGCCYPIFNLLKILAAHGKRIYNDDTKLRILEIIKQIKSDPDIKRKGMFTTGMISDYEGHQIALFLNGRQHAGENLTDILNERPPDLKPIIQMCDGLAANIPSSIKTIICNCLSHAFRKFEELHDFFPQECITVMRALSIVYKNDEKTAALSDKARLAYHQKHSAPVLNELKSYMENLLSSKLIEPNSELGKAIAYMLKRWDKLTRFLSVAGAPLDSNIVERALKIAIRNRKSAMFYKTCYSAEIGGMLTSLIYTCHLADQNALHYLTVLQEEKERVMRSPERWLPWNYLKTHQSLLTHPNDANHQEH